MWAERTWPQGQLLAAHSPGLPSHAPCPWAWEVATGIHHPSLTGFPAPPALLGWASVVSKWPVLVHGERGTQRSSSRGNEPKAPVKAAAADRAAVPHRSPRQTARPEPRPRHGNYRAAQPRCHSLRAEECNYRTQPRTDQGHAGFQFNLPANTGRGGHEVGAGAGMSSGVVGARVSHPIYRRRCHLCDLCGPWVTGQSSGCNGARYSSSSRQLTTPGPLHTLHPYHKPPHSPQGRYHV